MKQLLLFFGLSALLFQTGCAIQPPIDQQTLEHHQQDQANRKSDAFASDLAQ